MTSRKKCTLSLSTGESIIGDLIGAPIKASGELVFTTGMVGYSEALTDPSYYGQILLFTYPLIGNYGVPSLDPSRDLLEQRGFESSKVHASAVIVAEDSARAFHWNSRQTLDEWLKEKKIPGISGVDPRYLVHLIRENKGLSAKIIPDDSVGERFWKEDGFYDPGDSEVISNVSVQSPLLVGKGKKRIAVVDCGVKWNILRQIRHFDNQVEIMLVPWNADFSKVDAHGWLLSNGPGDPLKTGTLIERVKTLTTGDRPILGICLGHQILSLALGATTTRMKYGHRSHNQPAHLVGTRRGYVTSQNHGYEVDKESLPEHVAPWFVNANDGTIEGIRHTSKPFRSVQFHPEAAGGPRDTSWIIKDFVAELK